MPYKIEFKNVNGKNVCMKFKNKTPALKEKLELNRHKVYVKLSKLEKGDKC